MKLKTTRFLYAALSVFSVLFLVSGMLPARLNAQVAVTAAASCADAAGDAAAMNEYFIEVSDVVNDTATTVTTFQVTIGDDTQEFTAGSGLSLFFGPFDHSGAGGAVQVVSAVDDTNTGASGNTEVPEVLCGVTPDGGQASGGFCMPTTDPDANTGAVLAQSAPGSFMAGGTSGQIQTYVLVDAGGFIVEANLTGLFTALPSDTFMVFAVNYRDTEPLDDFLLPGQSFDPVLSGQDADATNSPLDGACFTICNTDPVIMVPVNCLSIGSTVFQDNDDDALFEPGDGEVGIPNVSLNLFTESDPGGAPGVFDSLVATTTTDPTGNYFFGGLDEGNYVVSIPTTPDGFPLSSTNAAPPEDVATGDDMDSGLQAAAGDSVVSPVIMLTAQMEPTGTDEAGQGSGQDDDVATATSTSDDDANGDMTVDFGFIPTLSLGSTVFIDVDDDGMQDATDPAETGIPNVTVNLYGPSSSGAIDSLYATTQTDAMGNYLFDMLLPGDYVVGVVPSAEFPVSSTGGQTDPNTGTGGGTDADDNGVFSDLMMTPITDVDAGSEVFSGVVMLMAGMEPTAADGETAQGADQDGLDGSPTDANGNMTVDFGFVPGVSIGSTVFFDLDNDGLYEPTEGESGIEGVEVYLYAADGVTVLDSTETDANGNYFFGGLAEGVYQVGIPQSSFAMDQPLFSAPNSSTPTEFEGDNQSDNNDNGIQAGGAGTIVRSGPIDLMIGMEPTADGDNGFDPETGAGADQDNMTDANGDMTIDFGFFPTLSIGSQVFYDADNSGDDNGGTDEGIDGVEVLLFADVDGDNMYTPGVDTLVDMTVTTGGGLYEFDTLPPGDYIVAVIPPDTANLSSNGPAENTADDQSDGNDNGIQGMAGDTVFSTAINLTVGEEPEDEDGPGGDQDMPDDQDDDGDMTVDFGLLPSVSVGSTVFQDDDDSGVQEGDEDGVQGIIVTLLDGNGMVVATDTTDTDGNYFFDGLTPGDYQLQLTPPDSLPTSSTTDGVNGEDGDSDDDGVQDNPGDVVTTPIFTLTPNQEPVDEDGDGSDLDDANDNDGNTSFDFGLVPNYSLGSTVFADLNNNTEQDDDEDGVAGVPVTLYSDVDRDGFTPGVDTIVATTVTDTDGNYFFGNLLPGDYTVGIVPTDDLPLSSDEDLDEDDANADEDGNDNGMQEMSGDSIFSGTVTLGIDGGVTEPTDGDTEDGQAAAQDNGSDLDDAAGNQTVDFGLFPGVSVGSTVFFDANNNGVNDVGENGISGVEVVLFTAGGMPVDTAFTDDNGNYFFAGLPQGDYFITLTEGQLTAGGLFETVSSSSTGNGQADDDIDNVDDGSQAGGPGTVITSGIFTLSPGDEPVNGNDPATNEFNGGATQDDLFDANGNMTVDFGLFTTQLFDLALIKTLGEGQINTPIGPGDNVTFDVTVINQGAINADNIALVDYIPDGLIFDPALNDGWRLDANGNAVDTLTVADGDLPEDGLEPGQRTTVQIVLTVAPAMFADFADGGTTDPDGVMSGDTLVNVAEITSATDTLGVVQNDIDSVADSDPDNDGDFDDNDENGGGDTDGDGINDDDEDDSDPAIIVLECFQDPGADNDVQVCLGCDGAEVVVNLFESLGGLPNVGGAFSEGALIFLDEDGNSVTITDTDGNALGSDDFDPTSVVIPGTLDRSLDFSIDYTIPAVNGCMEMTSTITFDIIDLQNLACTGFQNISLGENCAAEITPDLILQGNLSCASALEVVILSTAGDTLRDPAGNPTNTVGASEVNETLYVSLVDPMCDNSCWGQILVEDKKRPNIECPDDADGFDGIDFLCEDIDRILNQQSSLAFTGNPLVSDNCTPDDRLVVEFSDFLIPNADPQCTPSTILRTFTVTDASGNFNSCVQRITVRPATLEDVELPTLDVVEISCGVDFEALPNGNPVPALGGEATITTAFGTLDIPGSGSYCTIAASFVDSERITTCPNTFKFVRTYTIFDWCPTADGPLRDTSFTQVIKVGDFEAPEFIAPTQDLDFDGVADNGPLLFATNVGGTECAAIFRLDDTGIELTDNCSQTIALSAQIFPNGDTTIAPIGAFTVDLNDGDAELTTPVPVGTHVLRYTYVDACGNADFTDVDIEITDRTAPVAVCENGLNISITAGQSLNDEASTGIAVLTPDMIDAGSTDDCSGVTLEIGLVDAEDNVIGNYGDEIRLTCDDLGVVRVGLKVTDALDNTNFCWLDVLVEDKNAPTCLAPASITLSCTDYQAAGLPADVTEAVDDQLDALFGFATGIDNCEATITSEISSNVNSCGVGTLTREFLATDGEGFVNNAACTQTISIFGVYDYTITFPTDKEIDCFDLPEFDGLANDQLGCDLLTFNTMVDTITTQNAPEACYTLRVTYDVINFCEYNQLGQPYRIPRDGDGIRNPDTDLLYLNVIANNNATTDDDIAFLSGFTDRNFNPGGPQEDQLVDDGNDNDGSDDDNDNDSEDSQALNGIGFAYAQDNSRGFFRYIQYIDVYDQVAPSITGDEPEDCFAGTSADCTADVTLTFTATDNCTVPVVVVELDANYLSGSFVPTNPASVDVSVSNDEGDYTVVATNVPVGDHAIRVRANDGCGNFDTEIIEFCVTGDKAPTPICIQTLTVTLMPDGLGGGMAAIWASDFIASDVEDCFDNVIDKYSIYTEEEAGDAAFQVDASDTGIAVTCDDLGELPVRVYAIADNGTADYCSVVVEVQAFQQGLCEDNGGNLAGIIMTEEMNTVENAVVTIEGANNFTATMTTTDNGAFRFTGLTANVDYTVTPTHFTDYMNGVRTSDIVGITQHILGLRTLDSPYKLIAADVTGDEEINVGDIINIRRLILGFADTYPNGMPSWSFVPADYAFATALNPWAEAFPGVINVNDLTANVTDADFVGVKLGDVNGSAVANLLQPAAPRSFRGDLELELDETEMIRGETYTIPVTAPKLTGVQGYQFTLEFDRTAVTIDRIEPGLVKAGNFGFRLADRGLVTTSWNWEGGRAPTDWNEDEVLFSLVVRAEASGKLSEAIEAGSRYTEAEAYLPDNGGLNNLTLVFNGNVAEVAGYDLLQNIPNPVRRETTLGYRLPRAHDEVTITITDAAGRRVREFKQEGVVGYNAVRITKRQLGNASGVYTYTVAAGDWVATKRMVIIE